MTGEEIKLLQNTQLYLMRYIHSLCVENNIKYYLIAGAALGAKRHGGVIPWDVDIDIGMPREDYDKFKEICLQKLDSKFIYRDYTNTKNIFSPHALVGIRGSVLHTTRDYVHKNDVEEIFVDIFPLDTAPTEKEKQQKQAKRLLFIRGLMSKKRGFLFTKSRKEKFVKGAVSALMFWLSFYRIGQMREKEMKKYLGCGSGLLCSMGSRYSYFKQLMPQEIYGTPTPVSFDGETFFAPEKLEEYLTRLYGDYMKMPPEEERQIYLNYFKDISVPAEIVKELMK